VHLQTVPGGPFRDFVVSGGRKIGSLLSSCGTRLKILELEPDEESTSSFHDTSLSD